MTDKSFIAKPSVELRTIVRTVTIEPGERDNTVNEVNLLHQCSKGINIKFRNLIYRARQNIFWDQCKLN